MAALNCNEPPKLSDLNYNVPKSVQTDRQDIDQHKYIKMAGETLQQQYIKQTVTTI